MSVETLLAIAFLMILTLAAVLGLLVWEFMWLAKTFPKPRRKHRPF